jgi:2-iminobutanoate/2-iminopropanoate deaminase
MTQVNKVIRTDKAPAPVGPYSQAIECGNVVFLSGQIGLDPATGVMVDGGVTAQTRRIFASLRAVLDAASLDLSAVAKVTVFLTSMDDFAAFNKIYEKEFGGAKPARSVVEVARLPKNAAVEIEAIACR